MIIVRKILILILVLPFLTGCSAIYDLSLQSSVFNEKLIINASNKERLDLALSSSVATDYRYEKPESNDRQEGTKYYIIKKENPPYNISYQSNFTSAEYYYSTIIFQGAKELNYKYEKKITSINLLKPISAFASNPDLDSLTIRFSTNHKIINHNADEIIDDYLYFYLTKENYLNKKINIEINNKFISDQADILKVDQEGYFSSNTLVAIYLVLAVVIATGAVFIYSKVKYSNQ